MIGASLGPYRIERELGRGGQAVVYLAEDTRLARRVALKVFPPDFENAAWLRAKIAREVDLTSRLNDPGVCAVHDAGEISGHTYIAMQFVEGDPLALWLEPGPPLQERLALARARPDRPEGSGPEHALSALVALRVLAASGGRRRCAAPYRFALEAPELRDSAGRRGGVG